MPMIAVARLLPLVAVVLLGLGLRTWDLARRPMHADEANQAVKTGELLEHGVYRYDPADHHGPTLYYAALPVAWIRGETTLAELTETTVRWVPALHGAAAVALLGWLVLAVTRGGRGTEARPVGASLLALGESASPNQRKQACSYGNAPGSGFLFAALAAAFLAISPPAVYYSRYFIQETLLATYLLLAVVAGVQWWRSGRLRWAIVTGVGTGLLLATKESAIVFLGAAAAGVAVARPGRPDSARIGRDSLVVLAAALLVAVAFYSSFGTHPTGIVDAFRGLTHGSENAGGVRGHEKAWWYYLQLLTWQKNGGLVWHQVLFTTLAVIGCVAAWVSRHRGAESARYPLSGTNPHGTDAGGTPALPGQSLLRGCSVFAAIVLIALSAVPYKTPWNLVGLLPALALLAAGGLVAIAQLRTGRVVAAMFGFLAAATLLGQLRLTVFQRATDARNPYAYVHSAPDVLKYRGIAETARAAFPGEPIQVIGDEHWPLPWYLRGLDNVGYWPTPPAELRGSLLIVAGDQAEAVRSRLSGRYRERFLGLRPGYANILFIREGS